MSIRNLHNVPSAIFKEDFPTYDEALKELSSRYKTFIGQYENHFALAEHYLRYGEVVKAQGWIIHLSIIRSQIIELFTRLIPYLLQQDIPFKLPNTMSMVDSLLDGKLGYNLLGKIISIYPEDDTTAIRLVKGLIPITEQLSGPPIPTDRQLYNIVYTRYGSFNPIVLYNNGIPTKHIYDEKGYLIPDPYSIPFKYPDSISWPFHEFTTPYPEVETKLMNFSYYPVRTLKADAKGKVIKALYFRKFYQISPCLIKEGKHNMFSDLYARDIRDRLKWQYQLQCSLYPKIPLPKAIAYYEYKNNEFFVMEYIKGNSLGVWLEKNTKDRHWSDLPLRAKIDKLEKLLQIFDVVAKLHKLGYVHRDINQFNIVTRKNGKIVLIDMELTWSLDTGSPSPPFTLGTNGFMSPEQEDILRPTIKEDIYALGALMIKFFSNINPNTITYKINESLLRTLQFFVEESEISNLIIQCLQNDPNQRPAISDLERVVTKYHNSLLNGEKLAPKLEKLYTILEKPLPPVVAAAIKGLADPRLLNAEQLWLSSTKSNNNDIVNNSSEIKILEGWHTGLAGPIWVLARATQLGFDISVCNEPFFNSWKYLKKLLISGSEGIPVDLYHGAAGIALAIAECLNSGLLPATEENLNCLSVCFSRVADVGSLASGIAGQGVALLSCKNWLPPAQFSQLLKLYIRTILDSQQSNGSWILENTPKDKPLLLGLSEGITGIVWFLLATLCHSPAAEIHRAVHKSLRWLKTKAKYGKNSYALTFIKAYEIYQELEYKKIAKKWLLSNPARKVTDDFTFKSGLVALGETYLEAAVSFNESQWMERAEWIAQVCAHTMQKKTDDQGFWILNFDGIITADLFHGCGGILHYLLRVGGYKQLSHPLWPPKH